MKLSYITLCSILLSISQLWHSNAQSISVDNIDAVINNTALPYYENIYLRTDKNNYHVGDTIYLRGDLFNAILNKQMVISRFIYVDLVDDKNSVLHREKIAMDTLSNAFIGYFPINEKLNDGVYSLRAYTYFMQNMGEEFFFSKKIGIGREPIFSEDVVSDNLLFIFNVKKSLNGNLDVELSMSQSVDINQSNVAISVIRDDETTNVTSSTDIYKKIDSDELLKIVLENEKPKYYIEQSMVLSGYLCNRKGKIISNTQIYLIGEDGVSYLTKSDSTGYVEVDGITWKNGTLFYVKPAEGNVGRFLVIKQDEPHFLRTLCSTSPYIVNDEGLNNSAHKWTNNRVVKQSLSVQYPYHSFGYLKGMADPIVSSTSYVTVSKVEAFGPPKAPTLVSGVQSKKRTNIQQVVDGPQDNNIIFTYNGGATLYWNPNVNISKDSSFKFTTPAYRENQKYTIIVSGVDSEGNPVYGSWRIEI